METPSPRVWRRNDGFPEAMLNNLSAHAGQRCAAPHHHAHIERFFKNFPRTLSVSLFTSIIAGRHQRRCAQTPPRCEPADLTKTQMLTQRGASAWLSFAIIGDISGTMPGSSSLSPRRSVSPQEPVEQIVEGAGTPRSAMLPQAVCRHVIAHSPIGACRSEKEELAVSRSQCLRDNL